LVDRRGEDEFTSQLRVNGLYLAHAATFFLRRARFAQAATLPQ
jgi:hypothetical protein